MTTLMRAVGSTEFDVLPAGRAAEAHRRFEAHGVHGRLVLTF
jgi:hypothetical protein